MKSNYEAKILSKADIEDRKEDLYGEFSQIYGEKFRGPEVFGDIINAATHGVEIYEEDDNQNSKIGAAVLASSATGRILMAGAIPGKGFNEGRKKRAIEVLKTINEVSETEHWISVSCDQPKMEKVVLEAGMIEVESLEKAQEILQKTGRPEDYEIVQSRGGLIISTKNRGYKQKLYVSDKQKDL
jgi:hypothetical protein